MKTLIELSDKSLMQVIRLSKQRQNEIKLQKFEKANWKFEKLKIKGNNKKKWRYSTTTKFPTKILVKLK